MIGFRLDYWGLRSLFWDATQRRMVVTDVSGQPIVPSSRVLDRLLDS